MLWIKICIVLTILVSNASLKAEDQGQRTLDVVAGQLELREVPEGVKIVQGDWRFSAAPVSLITDADFENLPLQNPFTANMQYLALSDSPSQGAFILKIRAKRRLSATLRLGGVVAAGELKLLRDSTSETIYQTPDFPNKSDSLGRNQIGNLVLTLNIEAGESFLIYNYSQKPFEKLQGPVTNIGLIGPLRVGSKDAIDRNFELSELFLKIPLGVFACLAVYSLLIFYSRRGEDKESLVLFLFNAAIFFKEFFSQAIYLPLMQPNHLVLTASAVGYSMPFFAVTVSIYFLLLKYPSRFLRVLFYTSLANAIISALNGLVLLNIVLVPNTSNLTILNTMVNAILFFLFFIPYAIRVAFKTRNYEAVAFSIGMFCFGAGTLIDFYNSMMNFGWPWVSMGGGMIFSLILAKNNSLMFAKAFDSSKKLNMELEVKNQEVESLNASLETKVIERTEEIKALLEHIPQGVLSLAKNGFVESNYSAHLPDILEQSLVAGQSFKTLFLDHCDMSGDERDQAWQSLLAAIGESSINFDVNVDKLPVEVTYKLQDRKKVVKLTWNTELDREDTVKRLLVTMLDITQEVEALRELEQKNKDLAIIKQLIEVGVKKASQFFGTAAQLLDENARILERSDLNIDTLKVLFVNMHTVKGAARTLQFKELSATLHEVESHYAAIIKNGVVIPRDTLLIDIKRAKESFLHYLQVNRDVLGRSEDFSKIQIDREFLEQHYQLLHLLDNKMGLSDDIKDVIHKNRDELTHLIFMSLDSVMNEILHQAEKIARDLQKEPPIVSLNVGDILINHRQEITIKNSFIHILRNALDHGIESAEERKAQGKKSQGTIYVSGQEDGSCIRIEVWDDGRGLAIDRLRQKAMKTKGFSADTSPQDIANTIFHQGVSTATSVSQISGRGVGMDAVKRFFEAEKGQIQVLLGSPLDRDQHFYSFKLRITLPRGDMQQDGEDENLASALASVV